MVFNLSSDRRYLNGELVNPPVLGQWSEADLFPEIEYEDFVAAGLFDIAMDDDDRSKVEEWLLTIQSSEAPLLFLIERCCDGGELLPTEMIETRLKDCPWQWTSACMRAIKFAPEAVACDLFRAFSRAVVIERARRPVGVRTEIVRRSTLTFFRPG